MPVFRVMHSDMMGGMVREEFYDSKQKAKKALRRMLKELMPTISDDGETVEGTNHKIHHRRSIHFLDKKATTTYQLMFDVWHKVSHENDEWDTYTEHLHIDRIEVR